MVKSDFDTLEEVPSKKVNMFVLTEHLSGGGGRNCTKQGPGDFQR